MSECGTARRTVRNREAYQLKQEWLVSIWDGMRLVCPNCRKGSIYRSLTEMNPRCPSCDISFEPNAGDFTGAMTIAYSLTAALVALGVFILETVTDLSLTTHMIIWGIFTVAFLIFCYRNMKGIWIGILYATTGLREDY